MLEFVEPRVRGLVSDHLGVRPEELAPEVSLLEDLAADSLDLVELSLAIETRFGIIVPEATIERVRTYGELVETVEQLLHGRREAEVHAEAEAVPSLVWVRVVPPRDRPGHQIERAGWLTPYTAETIAEDALRVGRGARLEMSVPPAMSDGKLAILEHQFAWLASRGIDVSIRREHHRGPLGEQARPHAAA